MVHDFEFNSAILFRPNEDEDSQYHKVYKKAAYAYQDNQVFFSYAALTAPSYYEEHTSLEIRWAEIFNVTSEDLPYFLLFNQLNQKVYVYQGDIKSWSIESITGFLNDAFEGKLEPWIYSEEPVDNAENDVKVVVARNYAEIVQDKTKDVFILFYQYLHPKHQKFIEETWEQLALDYSQYGEELVIAKINTLNNTIEEDVDDAVPEQIVQNRIHLNLYPKGNKEAIVYDTESPRELADLKRFLGQHLDYLRDADRQKQLI